MQLRVVPALTDHRHAWDALVDQQPLPSPFLRTWWLESVAGPRAHYLLILDGDTLVGGLPLTRRRLPGLSIYRFVGQGPLCPDHLDALALPGREDEVVACLRTWFRRPGHRTALLVGLVEDSLLARAWPGWVTTADVAPYGALPKDPDTYLMSLSGNLRHNIRRSTRRVDDAGVESWVATPDTVDRAMQHFGALQSTREGRGHVVTALPVLTRAIRTGVATGEARVDVMEARDGAPVAVCITFLDNERMSLYQVARSLEQEYRGAGTAQVSAVIRAGIELGCREFDMLRGPETYKSSFVDCSRDVVALYATHGARARAHVRLRALAKRGKRAAKDVAARVRRDSEK